MKSIITNRGWAGRDWNEQPYGYDSWDRFHERNCSEQGPNGLIRHAVTGLFCIGHGEGTWDYVVGEFS